MSFNDSFLKILIQTRRIVQGFQTFIFIKKYVSPTGVFPEVTIKIT